MRVCLVLFLGVVSQALSGLALAQSGVEDGQQNMADTIVVRGERRASERFSSTASTLTVSRQDIEAMGAATVGDILRQVPGLQVTTTGNGGIEIRMRGMSAQGTRLMVDGAPVRSSRQDADMPLNELPADVIERIEVMRSPTAQFEGAGGGTINIVLKSASIRRETHLSLTNQRFKGRDQLHGFLSQSGPLASPDSGQANQAAGDVESVRRTAAEQRWSYFVSLNGGPRAHGSDSVLLSSIDPAAASAIRRSDLVSQERIRASNDNMTITPRLSGRLSSTDQVNIRGLFSLQGQQGTTSTSTIGLSNGDGLDSSVITPWNVERTVGQLGIDWTHRFAGKKLDTTLAYERRASRFSFERRSASTLTPGGSATAGGSGMAQFQTAALDDARLETQWLLNSRLMGTLDSTVWTLGSDNEERRLRVDSQSAADGVLAAPFEQRSSITRQALWGQIEMPIDAWNTTMAAGLRAQSYRLESYQDNSSLDYDRLFWQPSINARTRLGPDTQLRWNIARITRTPGIFELISRTQQTTSSNSTANADYRGNPTLRPEATLAMDVGIDQRTASGGQGGLNVFVRRQTDVIARRLSTVGGRWIQQPDNVGDALVWGLEVDWRTPLVLLGPDWTFSSNASLLQSRMQGGSTDGKRIPGQARYLASLGLMKPFRASGGWYGGGALTLVGPSDFDQPGDGATLITGGQRSHAQLDIHVGSSDARWGFWRLNIYNVTDFRSEDRRTVVDANGIVYSDRSSRRISPRVLLTVGTRF